MRFRNISYLFFYVIPLMMLIGCGGKSGEPTTPNEDSNFVNYHKLVGVYTITFDFDTCVAETQKNKDLIEERIMTGWLPEPVVKVNSYNSQTNVVDFDMTVSNPYNIDAYDLRAIVYADNQGRYLQKCDSWTALYHYTGGWLANPFVAFSKDVPERKFERKTEHTANFMMYLPPGINTMSFALDVCFPGHATEPYEFTDFKMDIINPQLKSSTFVEVDVRDWQNDITQVYLRCPEITGFQYSQFSRVIGDTWGLTMVNRQAAPAGKYHGMLVAISKNSGNMVLSNIISIDVTADKVPPKWVSTVGITDVTAGDGQATVFWNMAVDPPNPPPIYYLLYMDTDSEPWDQLPVLRFWHNPYTFTGLENGLKYYFGIRTMDSANPVNIDTNTVVLSATPHTH